jgi:predicted dehydrogenase/threonine dehydrogenase-like Zn-dependent dehydrogenase
MANLQLFQDLRKGHTFLESVPYPRCGSHEVVIRSVASLISAGTERMLVEFGRSSYLQKARQQPEKVKMVLEKIRTDGLAATYESVNAKLSEPIAIGYCNAGIVLEVGKAVTDIKPGDRVVSNGPHAEVVCVGRNLVARIPDEVDFEHASLTVLSSIALNGVRILSPTLGEKFAVIGLGLIGQVTLDLLRAAGADATGFDLDPSKVRCAQSRGFEAMESVTGAEPSQFDGVIITAASKSNGPIETAAALCRRKGRIVGVGAFGMELPRKPFYDKELDFRMATSYGPGRYDPEYESKSIDYPLPYVRWTENRNFQAILGLMARGSLDLRYLITGRHPFSSAASAYDQLLSDRSGLGVVLQYDSQKSTSQLPTLQILPAPVPSTTAPTSTPTVAVVGAGNFTKVVMLPALKKAKAKVIAICSSKGASSALAARKFGISYATSSFEQILADSSVNTVFLTTPHHLHSRMAVQALHAGKNVFVEKPLAINLEQLAEVLKADRALAQNGRRPRLMVGFNRRFSPFSVATRDAFASCRSVLSMNYTVNAGAIPPEHWVHDPAIGGGRLIGEGCHFIDLMAFIADSPVASVQAMATGLDSALRCDNTLTQIEFKNGAVGALQYCSQGHKSFPKERLTVMGAGLVAEIENFRKLRGYGGIPSFSRLAMDKGHFNEVSEFLGAIRDGGGDPIPLDSLVNTTLATLAHVRSLEQNRKVTISELEQELVRLL